MSTATLEPGLLPTPVEEPRETYLNASRGILSWLLTKDHKRIALLYLITVTLMFFTGGVAITVVRLNLMTPRGGLVQADTYNPISVPGDGFFPCARGANGSREFLPTADDWCQGSRLSASQPGELVSLRGWGSLGALCHARRWSRYRLDVLHAVQFQLQPLQRRPHDQRVRDFRLFFDLPRTVCYRYDASVAGAGFDVVASAHFRLDHLRDQFYLLARRSGVDHGIDPGGPGTCAAYWSL